MTESEPTASGTAEPAERPSVLEVMARFPLFLTALTPAFILPGFFFPFVTPRNTFFRFCVEVSAILMLLAWARSDRPLTGRLDPIFKWFFLYLVALSVAALAGLAPLHSLYGDFERMGGVWAWLHLFAFYALLRTLMRKRDWTLLFRATAIVADFIVIWGASEFLPASVRNPAFTTTLAEGSLIGNQGLMAGYLLLAVFISLWLAAREKSVLWKIFGGASSLILVAGVGASMNRSAQLGLLLGLCLAGWIGVKASLESSRPLRRPGLRFIFAAVALAASALVLVAVFPEVGQRFGQRWKLFLGAPIDLSRTIQWREAVEAFFDRPITGVGPENHQIVVSKHFDPRIYQMSGNGVFDRTHNAWLELAATCGLVGIVTMAGMWIATLRTLRRGAHIKRLVAEYAVFGGALLAFAVYLTFWFFDVNSAAPWIAILAFLSFNADGRLSFGVPHAAPPVRSLRRRVLSYSLAVVILVMMYLQGFVPLATAHDLAIAVEYPSFEGKLAAFDRALNSSAPQTQHTFPLYSRFLRQSLNRLVAARRNPITAREADAAVDRGMIEANRFIARSPNDDQSYVEAARYSIFASSYYGDSRYLMLAGQELLRGIRASPLRPTSRVLLATIYLRLDDSVRARAQIDSALRMAPQYGATYFYAGKLDLDGGHPESAARFLAAGLARRYRGADGVYAAAVRALQGAGRGARAASFSRFYLESVYGPIETWTPSLYREAELLSPVPGRIASQLPILYSRADSLQPACTSALAFAALRPESRPTADSFCADLKSGHLAAWNVKDHLF